MKKYTFRGAAIRSLRSAITTHWLAMMTAVSESGWFKSELDPTGLMGYFATLKLKPGYVLRAYERREPPNSWGKVWAMPAAFALPDPVPNGNGLPPKPKGAVDDFMQVVVGDDSPYSYLCASLLARELEQFATLCPDSEWLNCFILNSDPWVSANNVSHALSGQGFATDKTKWRWIGQAPTDWRPTVFLSERSATVVFHAFSGIGRQRIITFEDHFLRGSYTFNRREEPVANGPNGYIW